MLFPVFDRLGHNLGVRSKDDEISAIFTISSVWSGLRQNFIKSFSAAHAVDHAGADLFKKSLGHELEAVDLSGGNFKFRQISVGVGLQI